MSKNGSKKKASKAVLNNDNPKGGPQGNPQGNHKQWISMKTALRVITAASIVMFILTAIQTVPALGWVMGLLYALLFGALVWVVFLITQVFFRWLRR